MEGVKEMLEKSVNQRGTVEIVNIDELVPKEHLLRKIDKAVNFDRIYELTQELYCKDNGRPSVDPVVLFKMVLIQHIYGLPSLRQTARDVQLNIAYRWFLGYNLNEDIPHFATVSYNFRHRFGAEIIEAVFEWILSEASREGFLSPEVVFVDATHVKANANVNKKHKALIPQTARSYERQLREEVNAEREENGKKPFDDNPPSGGTREASVSNTDPESGLFRKGEHKMCFAYGAHTVCDRNNFVLGVEVRPGNMHDSVVFDSLYEKVTARFPEITVVTADTGYKTPWICKKIFDDGRLPSMPYKRPMTRKGNHPWYEYVYDEYYDQVICPEYQTLNYSTTNRDGYREYKSDPNICRVCPTRELCTMSASCQKMVTRHIWQDYIEKAEDMRHSPLGKETYSLRSQTIERIFADAKEKHGMRYTQYRGLTQVTGWITLKYAAMNLKKLAIWKAKAACALFCLLRFLTQKHKNLISFA